MSFGICERKVVMNLSASALRKALPWFGAVITSGWMCAVKNSPMLTSEFTAVAPLAEVAPRTVSATTR
eukprot:4837348-Pyramimonas_sp.AAC.1